MLNRPIWLVVAVGGDGSVPGSIIGGTVREFCGAVWGGQLTD